MAIFHLDFKIVKRSEGRSSVAKAAYHARTRITDERTGDTYDYSRRTDLYGHFILAPVNAPEHIVKDSTALWNEVERVERQHNGQTSRYFDVAIPAELTNDDKKKLVLDYCQKNFVEKGMIADIAFHDLDSDNPHAHVMLTLKTIGPEGFGKKERSWNDRKMAVLWRESWSAMANSYLAAAGSSERIDHRSLQAQHEEALVKAAVALDNEEKALWLAKATETNRPAMKRIHSAKWRSKAAQEQRATEQAVRDAAKQEAVEVYKTFSELDLEIVVDVRSFTITHLAEPEEIVLPKTHPGSSTDENQRPVLVAPAPHTRMRGVKSYRDRSKVSKVVAGKKPSVRISDSGTNTILKTSTSQTQTGHPEAPLNVLRGNRLHHVRIISLNALQPFWLISSRVNLYGLIQVKIKLILSVKNMINVLLKITYLTKYWAVVFLAMNMRNKLSLTKMTISQHLMRSAVFQVVQKKNYLNAIIV